MGSHRAERPPGWRPRGDATPRGPGGAAAGVAYLWWFLRAMGMGLAAAAGFMAIFLLVALTITRFRAQLGPPHHEFLNRGPGQIMLTDVGTLSLFWANINESYRYGAGVPSNIPPAIVPGSVYRGLSASLSQPVRTNWWELVAMGGGAGFCALLRLIKLSFPGFPLHPVALPVASGGSIEGTVAAVFIAWAAKAGVLRWGGEAPIGSRFSSPWD